MFRLKQMDVVNHGTLTKIAQNIYCRQEVCKLLISQSFLAILKFRFAGYSTCPMIWFN